jgi:hypothetical protein
VSTTTQIKPSELNTGDIIKACGTYYEVTRVFARYFEAREIKNRQLVEFHLDIVERINN